MASKRLRADECPTRADRDADRRTGRRRSARPPRPNEPIIGTTHSIRHQLRVLSAWQMFIRGLGSRCADVEVYNLISSFPNYFCVLCLRCSGHGSDVKAGESSFLPLKSAFLTVFNKTFCYCAECWTRMTDRRTAADGQRKCRFLVK